MGKQVKVSNEDIKRYLQKISREYEFKYMFKGEKFGLVNNLNLLKHPVLILGPENDSEKYKGKMRLWAYGGSIATVDSETGYVVFPAGSRNYIPYLCDGYKNNKIHPEEFWQEGLFDDLDMPANEKYEKLLKMHDKSSGRIAPELLDLSVFGAYTRFLNRSVHQKYPTYPQEKSMQCVIAKNSMLNSVWKGSERSLVVIDVETHLFSEGTEHPRADFVVFDGEAFGLIEFKYLGQSMDGKENNLSKHYDDFVKAMKPQRGNKLFEQLKMKLRYLLGYGLIDESWQEKGKEMLGKKYDASVLWCGFYFLGDKSDISERYKDIVGDRIVKQLKPVIGKMPVRFQISETKSECIDEIRMDKTEYGL
ncbi:MAG: hypothetical protein K6G75_05805 [Lachnospiraceae bacterium]|nr:hypothetical protein [Lachnospiraceae bacterium]